MLISILGYALVIGGGFLGVKFLVLKVSENPLKRLGIIIAMLVSTAGGMWLILI